MTVEKKPTVIITLISDKERAGKNCSFCGEPGVIKLYCPQEGTAVSCSGHIKASVDLAAGWLDHMIQRLQAENERLRAYAKVADDLLMAESVGEPWQVQAAQRTYNEARAELGDGERP